MLTQIKRSVDTRVKKTVKEHVASEIVEDRDATLKALQQVERGWNKALDKIGARGGLTKGPDGTWSNASMSEAAYKSASCAAYRRIAKSAPWSIGSGRFLVVRFARHSGYLLILMHSVLRHEQPDESFEDDAAN